MGQTSLKTGQVRRWGTTDTLWSSPSSESLVESCSSPEESSWFSWIDSVIGPVWLTSSGSCGSWVGGGGSSSKILVLKDSRRFLWSILILPVPSSLLTLKTSGLHTHCSPIRLEFCVSLYCQIVLPGPSHLDVVLSSYHNIFWLVCLFLHVFLGQLVGP